MASESKHRIYGVDFSGAQDAGRKIWITGGEIEDDELVVKECQSAADKFGERKRNAVLKELREFVLKHDHGVFGFDFPFALPEVVTDATGWQESLQAQPIESENPDEFRKACTRIAGGHELRETEAEVGALCSYNKQIQYQTFYGIRDLLSPLLSDSSVSVLPMMDTDDDRPRLLEVYPAGTLDEFGLCHRDYKNDDKPSEKRRERNLDGILSCGNAELDNELIRNNVINDSNGDALDSIVAAVATFRAVNEGPPAHDKASHPEGHIYV